jgi:CheY-like chemotaxis protein
LKFQKQGERNFVSKRKLLLADDSVTIQKVVNLTFADEGIEVISVGDGDLAMEKIRETLPDLVMLDINMPGLSGYEICENLRKSSQFKSVPVILLVGSFEPFDEDEAKRVGANDYLTKPFQSIRQLVSKVTDLLAAVHEIPSPSSEEATEMNTVTQRDEIVESSDFSTEKSIPQFDRFDDSLSDELLENKTLETDNFDFSNEQFSGQILETEKVLPDAIAVDENISSHKMFTEKSDVEEKSFEVIPATEAENEASSYIQEVALTKEKPFVLPETSQYFSEVTNDELIDNPLEVGSNDSVITLNDSDQDNLLEAFPFPKAASILELDEFDLLEIAPREEDFLVNIEEEDDFDSESIFDDSGINDLIIFEPANLATTNMVEPEKSTKEMFELDEEIIDEIVRRVINKISDNVVREIAWEVVPQKADEILKHSIAERFESK